MQGLAFLGDDRGVADLFENADEEAVFLDEWYAALFHHLAAAAYCRLAKESSARRYWKKALSCHSSLLPARRNLEDLEKPPGEGNGPWYFGVQDRLPLRLDERLSSPADELEDGARLLAGAPATLRYFAPEPTEPIGYAWRRYGRGSIGSIGSIGRTIPTICSREPPSPFRRRRRATWSAGLPACMALVPEDTIPPQRVRHPMRHHGGDPGAGRKAKKPSGCWRPQKRDEGVRFGRLRSLPPTLGQRGVSVAISSK